MECRERRDSENCFVIYLNAADTGTMKDSLKCAIRGIRYIDEQSQFPDASLQELSQELFNLLGCYEQGFHCIVVFDTVPDLDTFASYLSESLGLESFCLAGILLGTQYASEFSETCTIPLLGHVSSSFQVKPLDLRLFADLLLEGVVGKNCRRGARQAGKLAELLCYLLWAMEPASKALHQRCQNEYYTSAVSTIVNQYIYSARHRI